MNLSEIASDIPEERTFLKKIRDRMQYKRYKILIKRGLNQSEIAKRLEIKPQAVSSYIKYHPELGINFWNKGKKRCSKNLEKISSIKELVSQRLTALEIFGRVGYSNVRQLSYFLKTHPETPKPIKESTKVFHKVKDLIEEGLNQREIAERMGYSGADSISAYFGIHPDLRERYWEIRGRKK